MKGKIALMITGIAIIVLYSLFFISGRLPPFAPAPLLVAEAIVLLLTCFILGSGFDLQESRRFIHRPQRVTYTEGASSEITRVVRDGVDGSEVLVFGFENATFRDACIASWQFESASRNSNWLIKDDRGNDITNSLLSSFDGIAVLIGDYGTQSHRESLDTSAEYSDLRDSVEYFDD